MPVPEDPYVANRVPDVINYAWREYGIRVGLWRVADVLDAAGVKASVALNSAVCETFPRAMEEMKKRAWEFMGQFYGIAARWATRLLSAHGRNEASLARGFP